MAIQDSDGNRLTPRHAAKLLVADFTERADYWAETDYIVDVDALNERESDAIARHVQAQISRVLKFLRVEY